MKPIERHDGERVLRLCTGCLRRYLKALSPEYRNHIIQLLKLHLDGPEYNEEGDA